MLTSRTTPIMLSSTKESTTSCRRRRFVATVASMVLVFLVTSPSLDVEGVVSRMLEVTTVASNNNVTERRAETTATETTATETTVTETTATETTAIETTATETTTEEPQKQPNMILLVLDQWRHDWDGMTTETPTGPLPLKMPFLKMAAEKGVRFTQAYVPTPLCAPVRACLASGKEYDHSGVLVNHCDDWPVGQETFYKLMRDQSDYDIFTCGKDDLYKDELSFPFFPNNAGGHRHESVDLGFTNAMRSVGKHRVTKEHKPYERFRSYLDEKQIVDTTNNSNNNSNETTNAYDVYKDCFDGPTGPGRTWPADTLCTAEKFTSDIYPDDFVQREAVGLISQRNSDKPFYLQVNFPGPHAPEMSTAAMAASVSGRSWPAPYDAPEGILKCPQVHGVSDNVPAMGGRCNYAAELENLDSLMNTIHTYLIDTMLLDTTIVCIVGDHGEMLGDHNIHGKKVPWQASISVPLVCFGPGITPGVVYDQPVTTLDLGGTFMDFAGTTPNGDMTTQSMKSFLVGRSTAPPRKFVSSGLAHWRLVVQVVDKVSYKLICCKGVCGPRSPSTVPKTLADGNEWQMLLYDTQADRFDMSPIDDKPEVVEKLRKNLPHGWCTDATIEAKST